MEFPPYPNDDEDEQIHVYNIYHLTIDPVTKVQSRPRAINLSSKKFMWRHIMEIVLKCDKIDLQFRQVLEDAQAKHRKELGNKPEYFDRFVKTFRTAQLENSVPLGFDIYWDEEPNVLL